MPRALSLLGTLLALAVTATVTVGCASADVDDEDAAAAETPIIVGQSWAKELRDQLVSARDTNADALDAINKLRSFDGATPVDMDQLRRGINLLQVTSKQVDQISRRIQDKLTNPGVEQDIKNTDVDDAEFAGARRNVTVAREIAPSLVIETAAFAVEIANHSATNEQRDELIQLARKMLGALTQTMEVVGRWIERARPDLAPATDSSGGSADLPECAGENPFGVFPSGGGCNAFGCFPAGGGCNASGCFAEGGACDVVGCAKKVEGAVCR